MLDRSGGSGAAGNQGARGSGASDGTSDSPAPAGGAAAHTRGAAKQRDSAAQSDAAVPFGAAADAAWLDPLAQERLAAALGSDDALFVPVLLSGGVEGDAGVATAIRALLAQPPSVAGNSAAAAASAASALGSAANESTQETPGVSAGDGRGPATRAGEAGAAVRSAWSALPRGQEDRTAAATTLCASPAVYPLMLQQILARLAAGLSRDRAAIEGSENWMVSLWQRLAVVARTHGALSRVRRSMGAAQGHPAKRASPSGAVGASAASGDAAQGSLLLRGAAQASGDNCAGIPFDANLGLSLFFTMLRSLNGTACDAAERTMFVEDIGPLVEELPVMSLAASATEATGSAGGEDSHASSVVLDPLRDFLFTASHPDAAVASQFVSRLRSLSESVGCSSSREDAVGQHSAGGWALPTAQRTRAMEALLGLAVARGGLCTFLMALHVLLGVGSEQQSHTEARRRWKRKQSRYTKQAKLRHQLSRKSFASSVGLEDPSSGKGGLPASTAAVDGAGDSDVDADDRLSADAEEAWRHDEGSDGGEVWVGPEGTIVSGATEPVAADPLGSATRNGPLPERLLRKGGRHLARLFRGRQVSNERATAAGNVISVHAAGPDKDYADSQDGGDSELPTSSRSGEPGLLMAATGSDDESSADRHSDAVAAAVSSVVDADWQGLEATTDEEFEALRAERLHMLDVSRASDMTDGEVGGGASVGTATPEWAASPQHLASAKLRARGGALSHGMAPSAVMVGGPASGSSSPPSGMARAGGTRRRVARDGDPVALAAAAAAAAVASSGEAGDARGVRLAETAVVDAADESGVAIASGGGGGAGCSVLSRAAADVDNQNHLRAHPLRRTASGASGRSSRSARSALTLRPLSQRDSSEARGNCCGRTPSRVRRRLDARLTASALRPLKVHRAMSELHSSGVSGCCRARPGQSDATSLSAHSRGGLQLKTPMLWSFGQNAYGELGFSGAEHTAHRGPVSVQSVEGGVVGIGAGNEHSVVLTESGEVLAVGFNDNGQCGQGTTGHVPSFTPVEGLSGVRVSSVVANNGCEHTLVVTKGGELYSFGYNLRGQLGHGTVVSELKPRLVRSLCGMRVASVSCSYCHTVVVLESGHVLSMGRNDFGQLGHGDTLDKRSPHAINDLLLADGTQADLPGLGDSTATASAALPNSRRIVAASCGQFHSMFVAADGTLYGCGKNDFGQVGRSEPRLPHKVPTEVPLSVAGTPVRAVSVACGYFHTVVLASNTLAAEPGARGPSESDVLCFGRNDYGQCGLGHNLQKVFGPQLVMALRARGVHRIAAGCYHTLCATAPGELFSFGRNNHGQLGTGDTRGHSSPTCVRAFFGHEIRDLAAGFYHSLVLVVPKGSDTGNRSSKPLVPTHGNAAGHSLQQMLQTTEPWSSDRILGLRCFAVVNSAQRSVHPSGSSEPLLQQASTVLRTTHEQRVSSLQTNARMVSEAVVARTEPQGVPLADYGSDCSGCSGCSQCGEPSSSGEWDWDSDASDSSVAHHTDDLESRAQRRRRRLRRRRALHRELQRGVGAAGGVRPLSDAEGGSDASHQPFSVAVFILAHLGRLAENHMQGDSEEYPSLASTTSSTALPRDAAFAGVTRPFVVDTSVETLELLRGLLAHLYGESSWGLGSSEHEAQDCEVAARLAPSWPSASDSTGTAATELQECHAAVRPAMLIFLLRVLRANLHSVLTVNDGATATAWASEARRVASSELQTSAAAAEFAHPHSEGMAALFARTSYSATDGPSKFACSVTPHGSLPEALRALHEVLMWLVVSPPTADHGVVASLLGSRAAGEDWSDAKEGVSQAAAEALMTGLQLFYPLPRQQVSLLCALMAAPGDVEAAAGLLTPSDARTAAARKYLLEPLLDRLSADAVACHLVPPIAAAADDTEYGEADTSGTAIGCRPEIDALRALAAHLGRETRDALALAQAQASSTSTTNRHAAADIAAYVEQWRSSSQPFMRLLLVLIRHILSAAADATAWGGAAAAASLRLLAATVFAECDVLLDEADVTGVGTSDVGRRHRATVLRESLLCRAVPTLAAGLTLVGDRPALAFELLAPVARMLVRVDAAVSDDEVLSPCARALSVLAGRLCGTLIEAPHGAPRDCSADMLLRSGSRSAAGAPDHERDAVERCLVSLALADSCGAGPKPAVCAELSHPMLQHGLSLVARRRLARCVPRPLRQRFPAARSGFFSWVDSSATAVEGDHRGLPADSAVPSWVARVLSPSWRHESRQRWLREEGVEGVLCSSLRDAVGRQDAAYRMFCRRSGRPYKSGPRSAGASLGVDIGSGPGGLFTSEADAMAAAERATAAAALLQCGGELVAASIVAAKGATASAGTTKKRKLPAILLLAWRTGAAMRMWLASRRAELLRSNRETASIVPLCAKVIARARLLFDFVPSLDGADTMGEASAAAASAHDDGAASARRSTAGTVIRGARLETAEDAAAHVHCAERITSVPSRPWAPPGSMRCHPGWRRVRMRLFVVVRLLRIGRLVSTLKKHFALHRGVRGTVTRSVAALPSAAAVSAQAAAAAVVKFLQESATPSAPSAPQLLAAATLAGLRAATRAWGLSRAARLLRALRSPQSRADVLQWVPDALAKAGAEHPSVRSDQPLSFSTVRPGHYLCGVEGAPSSTRHEVKQAAATLLRTLASQLSSLLRALGACTESVAMPRVADVSADVRAAMLAIETLTTPLTAEECSLLAADGLFGVLSRFIATIDARLPVSAAPAGGDGAGALSSETESFSLRNPDTTAAETASSPLTTTVASGAGTTAAGDAPSPSSPAASPSAGRGADDNVVRRTSQLQACRNAAWRLLRICAIQAVTGGSMTAWNPAERACGAARPPRHIGKARALEILHGEALRVLSTLSVGADESPVADDLRVQEQRSSSGPARAVAAFGAEDEGVSDDFRASAGSSSRNQELIGRPVALVNMETGVFIPAKRLQDNPRASSGDFSLTFWLYLTQGATGHARVVLLRGAGVGVQRPMVVLRPDDTHLEVSVTTHYRTVVSLTSKASLPLFAWLHIAIVSEGARVKLFVNGTPEAQRSTGSPCLAGSHPLFVGKPPDDALAPGAGDSSGLSVVAGDATDRALSTAANVKGGFEGFIGRLCHHTRALSPIHVRIVFDQGPPALRAPAKPSLAAAEAHATEILDVLYPATWSGVGSSDIGTQRWLAVCLQLLLVSPSIDTAIRAARVIGGLLPAIAPSSADAAVREVTGKVNLAGAQARSWSGSQLVVYVLDLCGALRFRGCSAVSPSLACVELPRCARPVSSSPAVAESHTDGLAHTHAQDVAAATIALTEELEAALRSLAQAGPPSWRNVIKAVLNDAVQRACRTQRPSAVGSKPGLLHWRQTMTRAGAAIHVLGGQTTEIRVGAPISLAHGAPTGGLSTLGTVLHIDDVSRSASVALGLPSLSEQAEVRACAAAALARAGGNLSAASWSATDAGGEVPLWMGLPVVAAPVDDLTALPTPLLLSLLSGDSSDVEVDCGETDDAHRGVVDVAQLVATLVSERESGAGPDGGGTAPDDMAEDVIRALDLEHRIGLFDLLEGQLRCSSVRLLDAAAACRELSSAILASPMAAPLFQLASVPLARPVGGSSTLEEMDSTAATLQERLCRLSCNMFVVNNVSHDTHERRRGCAVPLAVSSPTSGRSKAVGRVALLDDGSELGGDPRSDPDADSSERAAGGVAVAAGQAAEPPSADEVSTLMAMGFAEDVVIMALLHHGNDSNLAANWLADNHDTLSALAELPAGLNLGEAGSSAESADPGPRSVRDRASSADVADPHDAPSVHVEESATAGAELAGTASGAATQPADAIAVGSSRVVNIEGLFDDSAPAGAESSERTPGAATDGSGHAVWGTDVPTVVANEPDYFPFDADSVDNAAAAQDPPTMSACDCIDDSTVTSSEPSVVQVSRLVSKLRHVSLRRIGCELTSWKSASTGGPPAAVMDLAATDPAELRFSDLVSACCAAQAAATVLRARRVATSLLCSAAAGNICIPEIDTSAVVGLLRLTLWRGRLFRLRPFVLIAESTAGAAASSNLDAIDERSVPANEDDDEFDEGGGGAAPTAERAELRWLHGVACAPVAGCGDLEDVGSRQESSVVDGGKIANVLARAMVPVLVTLAPVELVSSLAETAVRDLTSAAASSSQKHISLDQAGFVRLPDSKCLAAPNLLWALWVLRLLWRVEAVAESQEVRASLADALWSDVVAASLLPGLDAPPGSATQQATANALTWILRRWHGANFPAAKVRRAQLQRFISGMPWRPMEREVRRRMSMERGQGRLYFSSALLAVTELVLAIRCVDAAVRSSAIMEAIVDTAPSLGRHPTPQHESQSTTVAPKLQLFDVSQSSLHFFWEPLHPQDKGSDEVCVQCCPAPGAQVGASLLLPSGSEIASLPWSSGGGMLAGPASVLRTRATEATLTRLQPDTPYLVRARRGSDGPWGPPQAFRTGPRETFTWDTTNCGPSVNISSGGATATFTSSECWSVVLGNCGFSVGRNRWRIRTDRSSTAYLFIGVATRSVNQSTFLGGDEHGWGYIGDRALYHRRTKARAYGERFGQGDVIGVDLDMDRGTLTFSRNGNSCGVAFRDLSGELFPAVAFYNLGQSVTLVHDGMDCPGANVAVTGAPSQVTVPEVAGVAEALQSFASGSPLPRAFVDDAWEEFEAWRSGARQRYPTRSGFELSFDISPPTLGTWDVRCGDRVRTSRGDATVVGEADGLLWVHVDGDAGAWFIPHASSVDLAVLSRAPAEADPRVGVTRPSVVGTRAQTVDASDSKSRDDSQRESKEVDAAPTAGVSEVSGSGEGPSSIPGLQQSVPDELASVTKSTFTEMLDSTAWEPALDAALVWALSDACERLDVNPWNLQPAKVLDELLPDIPSFSARSPRRSIPGADHKGAIAAAPLGTLAGVCRLAALRLFNERLLKVLPLADLATILFEGACGACSSQGVPDASSSAPGCLCAWDTLATGGTGSQAPGATILGGICGNLAAARGAIFLHTKRQVIATVLDRTATRAKKADDDYDYPEDLHVLMLNRPRAAAVRARPFPTQRVPRSLIGQAFDELHFAEPSLLRLGYQHPMDDGQQRAFKVKLEGEGVDDYGGPYREFFAQVAQELQATTDHASGFGHRQGAKADECVLPLFRPTANSDGRYTLHPSPVPQLLPPAMDDGLASASSSGSGGGAEGDRFWLSLMAHPRAPTMALVDSAAARAAMFGGQPTASHQVFLELYHFIGQLIGVALRSRVHMPLALAPQVWKALVAQPGDASDLASVDEGAAAALRHLRGLSARAQHAEQYGSATASIAMTELEAAAAGLRWAVRLGDGRLAELRPNGAAARVHAEDVPAYCKLALGARLRESEAAAVAIRNGLATVVPAAVLPLLSWRDVERMVCGRGEVDIELLQRNTEYDEGVSPHDEHVRRFWRVLDGFDSEQRQQFLRFVWARSRLPASAAEFTQKFKLQAAVPEPGTAPGARDVVNDPDLFLPKAHTCFFSLNLPRYTSDGVMREKLLYAAYNCLTLDADYRLLDSEMGGWPGV